MPKLKILPVFIPFMGCPYKCIYCDQNSISGINLQKFETGIEEQITFYQKNSSNWDEIAFYGGSFNYLPKRYRHFLYHKAKALNLPIRVSAYPVKIEELIDEFKIFNVKTVELGIQSFSDHVLKANGRFYENKEILKIIKILKNSNIKVGIQLMVGMYREKLEDVYLNFSQLDKINFDYLRIYPTVILKNTVLETLAKENPLNFSFSEVVVISAAYYLIAKVNNKKILRIGLHNQKGLTDKITGGYFHPSFGDIVKTFIVYTYCKNHPCILQENFPNFKGTIAKNFQVIYDNNACFENICKKVFEVFFENNGRQIKRQIFEIAEEFFSKTNL